ncbi:MFS transporter [Actinocrispum wychmicini]|uniref:MFS-type transporter involved in bile tolerance (Atg22 family) n=1 Tax=Actinocrispum wychmicini TaxID=1213861 RepID=A0A4R2JPQ3_9PSEU|nr:MFS transporter [Actinocrispum wychmicini]TCO62161.1 MFS-type transporter involved in bile tolerance (Atg22 family) [Actinocrispum wychmicini]
MTTSGQADGDTSAVEKRNVNRMWVAAAAANVSDGLATTAMPLLVVSVSREPLALSTLNALWFLPWLLLGVVVGALMDRWDRRLAMVRAAAVRAVLVGLLAVAIAFGHGSLALLYPIVFVFGSAEIVYDIANRVLLPSLIPPGRLEVVNSWLVSTENVGQSFVGPLLAGVLFAVTESLPFAVIAVLLLVAAVAPWTIRGDFRPRPAEGAARPSIRREIAEGMRWLFAHRLLRHIAVMVGVLGFLGAGVLALLVLYARENLGLSSRMTGVFLAAGAVGGVLGSLVAPKVRQALGTGLALTLAVIVMGVATMGFAGTDQPVIAMVLFGVTGIGSLVWNIITLALRQALIPDEILGRVFTSYRLLAYGSVPLGATAAGLVATWTSLDTVFLLAGVLQLVLIAGYFRLLMVAGREYEATLRTDEAENASPPG